MHSFTAIIQKSGSWGEKSGWTYVDIPPDILGKLKLKSKKEFRIKGFADDVPISRMACFPIGEGNCIITLNAELRKKLGKKQGAMLKLKIELDERGAPQSEELLACLQEDEAAKKQFDSMPGSHRNYFHQYVISAKTAPTKAARIVNIINAMYKKQNFGEMIRSLQAKNK